MQFKVVDPTMTKKPKYVKAKQLIMSKLYRCVKADDDVYVGHILVGTESKDHFGVWLTFDSPSCFSEFTIKWDKFEFEEVQGTFTIEKVIHA